MGGTLGMRLMAVAMILLLTSAGGVLAYPMHASNGAVNCTVFGTFKDPWTTANANTDSYAVLSVDMSLERTNESDERPVQATYRLTDGNDRFYKSSPEYTRDLQMGRRLVGFVVPVEAIAKSIAVNFSSDGLGGQQLSIPFPEISNATKGNVTLRYYGVLRSWTASNKKTYEFDIGISNNGTEKLPLDAENFSLMDQWGWRYKSNEYDIYGKAGFRAQSLEPNGSVRSRVVFSPLSPLSRPVELIYQYSNHSDLALNIDSEAGLCPAAGRSECTDGAGAPEEEPDPGTLAGSIKATKARLAKVKGNITDERSPKGRDEL